MADAPVKTISVGNIQLSIWENTIGDGQVVQSITFKKNYMDKDKKWKSTTSLKFNELAFLQIAIQKAMEYRYVKEDDGKKEF